MGGFRKRSKPYADHRQAGPYSCKRNHMGAQPRQRSLRVGRSDTDQRQRPYPHILHKISRIPAVTAGRCVRYAMALEQLYVPQHHNVLKPPAAAVIYLRQRFACLKIIAFKLTLAVHVCHSHNHLITCGHQPCHRRN